MTLLSRRSRSRLGAARRLCCRRSAARAPTSRKKSASTGRPTTRSRCCSRTRASWRKNSPRTASTIRWVQTLGSNKALEFLNAGSIDFGSTAGSAALVAKINGNPIKSIYVYSRPEWTALVTAQGYARSPRSRTSRASRSRWCAAPIRTSSWCARCYRSASPTRTITPVLVQQHAGRQHRAHPRRRRCLGRPRPDDGAGTRSRTARGCSIRNTEANTWGILNAREEFLKDHPRRREARALGLRGGAQIFARQLRRAEEDLHRASPSWRTRWSTSSSRSAPS